MSNNICIDLGLGYTQSSPVPLLNPNHLGSGEEEEQERTG